MRAEHTVKRTLTFSVVPQRTKTLKKKKNLRQVVLHAANNKRYKQLCDEKKVDTLSPM